MRRLLPTALGVVALTACFDDSDPEFVDINVECEADTFDLRVLAKGDPNQVSNVDMTIEVDSVETAVFLDKDLDYDISGGFSQWELVDEALSCDGDYTFVLTATNVMGNDVTEVVYWPEPDVGLSDIVPAHGTEAGGTQVTINGDGLELVDRVTFDGVDATILLTAETAVIVESPAGAVGAVDVIVFDRGTESTYAEGFTYYADGTGLYNGFIRTSLSMYNPDFLNYSSPYATTYDDFVQLEMVLNDTPTAWDLMYPANYPVVDWGDCSGGSNFDSTPWATAGDVITLDNSSLGERSMVHATDGVVYYYVTDGVDYTAWQGQYFDLLFEAEDEFIPPQELDDAVFIPEAVTGLSHDWETKGSLVSGEDFTLSWDASTPHDGLEWAMSVTDSGNNVLSDLYCTVPTSDGELTVTWAELSDGIDESEIGRLFVLSRFHVREDTATFEHDNASFHTMGIVSYYFVIDVE